jgi:hypothetical protein
MISQKNGKGENKAAADLDFSQDASCISMDC